MAPIYDVDSDQMHHWGHFKGHKEKPPLSETCPIRANYVDLATRVDGKVRVGVIRTRSERAPWSGGCGSLSSVPASWRRLQVPPMTMSCRASREHCPSPRRGPHPLPLTGHGTRHRPRGLLREQDGECPPRGGGPTPRPARWKVPSALMAHKEASRTHASRLLPRRWLHYH